MAACPEGEGCGTGSGADETCWTAPQFRAWSHEEDSRGNEYIFIYLCVFVSVLFLLCDWNFSFFKNGIASTVSFQYCVFPVLCISSIVLPVLCLSSTVYFQYCVASAVYFQYCVFPGLCCQCCVFRVLCISSIVLPVLCISSIVLPVLCISSIVLPVLYFQYCVASIVLPVLYFQYCVSSSVYFQYCVSSAVYFRRFRTSRTRWTRCSLSWLPRARRRSTSGRGSPSCAAPSSRLSVTTRLVHVRNTVDCRRPSFSEFVYVLRSTHFY